MKEEDVPFIDLAPKLKRPLSLWNPLDYLRLLFWEFFFPQAFQWYNNTFGKKKYVHSEEYYSIGKYLERTHSDPVFRTLLIQELIAFIVASIGVVVILRIFGISIGWIRVGGGLVIGMLFGIFLRIKQSDAFNLAGAILFGLMCSVIVLKGNLLPNPAEGVIFAVSFGIFVGSLVVKMGGVLGALGFSFLMFVVVISQKQYKLIGPPLFVVSIFHIYHFFEYIVAFIYLKIMQLFNNTRQIPKFARLVFFPLPGVQKQLENQLSLNWEIGIKNANHILSYSFQLLPVVKALNNIFKISSNDILLLRVAELTKEPLDWKLIKYCSANINKVAKLSMYDINILYNEHFMSDMLFLDIYINTFGNAACAGFWLWSKKEYEKAIEAFQIVRELCHGFELYHTAQFIDNASKSEEIQSIASLEQEMDWLDSLQDPELRPGTLKAIRILKLVTSEARVAIHARAPLNRSTAINRAVADLTTLIETGETFCPEPERPLIKDIANKWKEVFSKFGGAIGEEVLRQPMLNPYQGYSGLPVTGHCFFGRADIMHKIETRWANKGLIPVLILFGHRRMGKTSVLRNLGQNADYNNIYVYIDMQKAGWVENTGQLLFDFAQAIQKVVSKNGFDIGQLTDPAQFSSFITARRLFDSLLERINERMTDSQRLVLAFDEFELIEQGIQDKRIDPGLLPYLRAINQEYPWLGLIFAGLHTLDEMGRDYQSTFYGQAEYIQLGYLTREDCLKLITQPHPDFSLEYEDLLIDEIYRLTFGQPYLVQRICWELVNHWNDLFLEKGKTIPRVLKLDDLKPVLTTEFYGKTGYYFDGVWSNATEEEKHLMHILVPFESKKISLGELKQEAKQKGFVKDEAAFDKAFVLLKRHDIITGDETGYGFASELMRLWVLKLPGVCNL